MTVFMVHGTYGNPDENWFPWMRKELDKREIKVAVPAFPTPEGQSLNNWMKLINEYKIKKEDILVGHSIGSALVLRILEKHKVRAAFLIAGFLGSLNNADFDKLNSTFFQDPIDWEKIKKNCKKIFVICSENDPYVPLEKAETLAEKLGTSAIIVKNAGHFNETAGYVKFEMLFDEIIKFF